MNNVIDAKIIKGKDKGEDVLILRIPVTTIYLSLDFLRPQFAITINKSQGQSVNPSFQNQLWINKKYNLSEIFKLIKCAICF